VTGKPGVCMSVMATACGSCSTVSQNIESHDLPDGAPTPIVEARWLSAGQLAPGISSGGGGGGGLGGGKSSASGAPAAAATGRGGAEVETTAAEAASEPSGGVSGSLGTTPMCCSISLWFSAK